MPYKLKQKKSFPSLMSVGVSLFFSKPMPVKRFIFVCYKLYWLTFRVIRSLNSILNFNYTTFHAINKNSTAHESLYSDAQNRISNNIDLLYLKKKLNKKKRKKTIIYAISYQYLFTSSRWFRRFEQKKTISEIK